MRLWVSRIEDFQALSRDPYAGRARGRRLPPGQGLDTNPRLGGGAVSLGESHHRRLRFSELEPVGESLAGKLQGGGHSGATAPDGRALQRQVDLRLDAGEVRVRLLETVPTAVQVLQVLLEELERPVSDSRRAGGASAVPRPRSRTAIFFCRSALLARSREAIGWPLATRSFRYTQRRRSNASRLLSSSNSPACASRASSRGRPVLQKRPAAPTIWWLSKW
jgi:hypothetical protein